VLLSPQRIEKSLRPQCEAEALHAISMRRPCRCRPSSRRVEMRSWSQRNPGQPVRWMRIPVFFYAPFASNLAPIWRRGQA